MVLNLSRSLTLIRCLALAVDELKGTRGYTSQQLVSIALDYGAPKHVTAEELWAALSLPLGELLES